MKWAIILACLFLCGAGRAQAEPRLTGTFSNMTMDAEGEDLVGMEILFVPGNAFVQIAAGDLNTMVLVPVITNGNLISFDVPQPYIGAGHYQGAITKRGFDGNWAPADRNDVPEGGEIHLKRQHSYWDR